MKAPKRSHVQPRLFQMIDMEAIVPQNHILRKLKDVIDFSQVHEWVASLYSEKMGLIRTRRSNHRSGVPF